MQTRSSLASSQDLLARLNLVGESAAFRRLLNQIERFAHCDATVLIDGETGTGKELAARAIHYLSARRGGPFIPINCGSIPDSLIGSELFGHCRGAFTDAREARQGLIAQADGGTLFLDELEALSARGQVALLRFLQDYEYRPLGAARSQTANVRIVGATNANLDMLSQRGEFRRDLFYRLNVLVVETPPLRSRGDDAVILARTFIENLNARYAGAARTLHPDALAGLRNHDWPGNIRELENLVHREYLLSDRGPLTLRPACSEFPTEAGAGSCTQALALTAMNFREAKAHAIEEFERAYVAELLTRSGGNISLAARLAGKERSRLGRLVRKYRLERRTFATSNEQPAAN